MHRLEITTDDPNDLLADLFGPDPDDDATAQLGDDVAVRFLGVRTDRGIETSDVIMLALTFPIGVATNVVADVIRDRMRQRPAAAAVRRIAMTSDTETSTGTRRTSRRQTTTIDLVDSDA
jgi:hypothetical protein